MLNRCKFLNVALYMCGISNVPCQFMADPSSCSDYDEDADRGYVGTYKGKSHAEVARAESKRVNMEVETLTEFTNRIESELDGMGIKVNRLEEAKKEEVPDWF